MSIFMNSLFKSQCACTFLKILAWLSKCKHYWKQFIIMVVLHNISHKSQNTLMKLIFISIVTVNRDEFIDLFFFLLKFLIHSTRGLDYLDIIILLIISVYQAGCWGVWHCLHQSDGPASLGLPHQHSTTGTQTYSIPSCNTKHIQKYPYNTPPLNNWNSKFIPVQTQAPAPPDNNDKKNKQVLIHAP